MDYPVDEINLERLLFEFNSLFGNEEIGPGEVARQCSVTCGFNDYLIRPLCWKFFLGIIKGKPGKNWVEQLNKSRAEFEQLKKNYMITPGTIQPCDVNNQTVPEQDLLIENPLSNNPESNWYKYQTNKLLENPLGILDYFCLYVLLDIDLSRLFKEIDLFRRLSVLESLKSILLLWTRENEEIGYQQVILI
jgi:hypothetical protein